ncbi:MAG: general secretion pathway protein GspK [Bdellovibrio sp.]|nr:general secretion pathway protein GspK [Bdellovibrio sp.]
MEYQQESKPAKIGRDSSGIALFMVLAAIAMLTVLVSEFTYVSQVNQTIAFGALDEAKAHYLAKSGLKISLLRLKAYQQVKALIANMGKGATQGVPRGMIEKIWSFPFFYPIPTSIPGISNSDKDLINKFQKESGLDGKFSATIESESQRFNINFIVPGYAPMPSPSASPSPSPTPTPGAAPTPNPTSPAPTPSPAPSFDPEAARQSLSTLLGTILNQKFEEDQDFAANYRDLRLEDLVDNIAAWADRLYDRRTTSNRDKIPMKRAPFYSITELHFLANIDDDLYRLFTPVLTVSPTAGINVNTIDDFTLKALVPQMVKEERAEFFKFRDDPESDNSFREPEAFFKYLQGSVSLFRDQYSLDQFKGDLQKRNINIVTDETYFKITVRASVNSATRTIEAWVTLGSPDPTASAGGPSGRTAGAPPSVVGPGPNPGGGQSAPGSGSESGLKITAMKIY